MSVNLEDKHRERVLRIRKELRDMVLRYRDYPSGSLGEHIMHLARKEYQRAVRRAQQDGFKDADTWQ